MRSLFIIFLTVTVTGCASVSPSHPHHDSCDKVASYARGIEVLKQVGVTQTDTVAYVSQPTVAHFPMQRVRSLVYLKNFETPAEAYVYFYDMCTVVGHDKLLAALDNAEKQQLKYIQPSEKLDRAIRLTPHPQPKMKMKKSKRIPPNKRKK